MISIFGLWRLTRDLYKLAFFNSDLNWIKDILSEDKKILNITRNETILKMKYARTLKQLRSFVGSNNPYKTPIILSLTENLRSLLKKITARKNCEYFMEIAKNKIVCRKTHENN